MSPVTGLSLQWLSTSTLWSALDREYRSSNQNCRSSIPEKIARSTASPVFESGSCDRDARRLSTVVCQTAAPETDVSRLEQWASRAEYRSIQFVRWTPAAGLD